MFTGIVEVMGRVDTIRRGDGIIRIRIEAPEVTPMEDGKSIAVSGVCLTSVATSDSWFEVEAIPETLRVTNLGALKEGSHVNLERAMEANGRFDGHIVQGHVDGKGVVSAVEMEGEGSKRITIEPPEELAKYLVYKGSVAVDGVSLTVAAADDRKFEVALIPHTLDVTTLGERQAGDIVNIECDVIAKYVERLLGPTTYGEAT